MNSADSLLAINNNELNKGKRPGKAKLKNNRLRTGNFKNSFPGELLSNWQLYIMALPAIIWLGIFSYYPLLWLQVAFKDFNIQDGAWKSPWVGLENFKFYFESQYFITTTVNTLYLNALFIIVQVFVSVGLALLLNEMGTTLVKKIYQSVLFLPFFLSWIVISAFVYNMFSESFGSINTALKSLGFEPVSWYSKAELWPAILTILNTWQSAGYYVIIYMASIISVDPELYEAVRIDGANKFHEIKYITMPHLLPTIVLMVLLQIGKIFYGNFQMIYSIVGDNGMLFKTTEIIDTYIYRAMSQNGTFGQAAAIGIYQSILGFIVVILSNKLAKKYDDSMGLF